MICWRSGRRLGRGLRCGPDTRESSKKRLSQAVDWAESMHAGGVVSSRPAANGVFRQERSDVRRRSECCGRLPRTRSVPDRAPNRQRRLRGRLEAWDGRLERPVAVKAIDTGVAEEAAGDARGPGGGAPQPPGIVTLYEIGEEEGNALLVTELVDGDTLARKTRSARSATARSARSAPTSARRWTTPTPAASSIATSSRRTSSSPRAASRTPS